MNAKEIVTYAGTVLLSLGAFVLVWQKVITWPIASAFVLALLFPSAAHVGVQRAMASSGGDK